MRARLLLVGKSIPPARQGKSRDSALAQGGPSGVSRAIMTWMINMDDRARLHERFYGETLVRTARA
jgi:hypothetical protein